MYNNAAFNSKSAYTNTIDFTVDTDMTFPSGPMVVLILKTKQTKIFNFRNKFESLFLTLTILKIQILL